MSLITRISALLTHLHPPSLPVRARKGTGEGIFCVSTRILRNYIVNRKPDVLRSWVQEMGCGAIGVIEARGASKDHR